MGLEEEIQKAVAQTWSVFGRRWWFALEREDATQHAFMVCWSKRDRFDPARSSAATFFSLVARQAITNMNRAEMARRTESLNTEVGEDVEWISTLPAPAGRDLPVENELVDLVEGALEEAVTVPQADTVRRIVAGQTVSEIARDRGTSHQAVSKQYRAAVAGVQKALSVAETVSSLA